jgi:drug/metabolite transporter (DMT)-like permease
MLLTVLALVPVMIIEARTVTGLLRKWRSNVVPVAALGAAGSLVAQLCLNWGLQRSLASNASVLSLTVPVLMAILATVILREKWTRIRALALGISIVGVLLISDIDRKQVELRDRGQVVGNLLVFISCGGSAFYNVYSKRVLEILPPSHLLVGSFVVLLVLMLPFLVLHEPGSFSIVLSATPTSVLSTAAVGLLSLAPSMILYFRVLQQVDAMQAAVSIYLMPLFGVLLSAATLQESITPGLAAGGLLVALGALVVTVFDHQQPEIKAKGVSA